MSEYDRNDSPDALERIFRGRINWVNLCMVAANIVVFVIAEMFGNTTDVEYMLKIGASYTPYVLTGEWYRLFSSMFLHFGIEHLFQNMVMLLFLGDMLEEYVGKWKHLLISLGGGILGNVLSLIVELKKGDLAVSAGASGVVFAVIGGVLIVIIKNGNRIREISSSRIVFVIALSLFYGFQATGVDNAAHIGGLLGGILLCTILYRKKVDISDRDINR